jgi:hypothetical protein
MAAGALVFYMQAGFAMLEAGIVQPKNATNILFKNMLDASLAAMCFWLLGYGIAYGTDKGGFIGSSNFAIDEIYNGAGGGGSDGWEGWFFQWAFAGAAATIVAGSVCERMCAPPLDSRLPLCFLWPCLSLIMAGCRLIIFPPCVQVLRSRHTSCTPSFSPSSSTPSLCIGAGAAASSLLGARCPTAKATLARC